MARGFLSGAIWGAVFSGAGVAALSLNTPLPERVVIVPPPGGMVDSSLLDAAADRPASADPVVPVDTPDPDTPDLARLDPDAVDPDAVDPSKPRVVETPGADPVAKPDLSKPGLRPQPESGVDRTDAPLGAPVASADPVIAGADTDPLARPRVGDVPDAPDAPDSGVPDSSDGPAVAVRDAPVVPGGQLSVPGAPRPEAQPIIITGPAQPPAPAVPDGGSALVADGPDRLALAPEPVGPGPDPAPDPDPAPAPEPVLADEGPVPDPAPDVTAPDPDPDLAPDPAPEAVELADPLLEAADPTAVGPAVGPSVGKPATSLFARTPQATPDPEPQSDPVPLRPAALAALPEDSPLVMFSAPVTVAEGVPRMSVVLIDDGIGPLGPSGLRAFPFPVSFAISTSHPDPAGAAKGYRDLGFEVLVLGGMPEGARASDVEVTMEGLFRAVPEAVAMLEDPDGSLQDSREISAQVTAFLGDSGHGVIMQPKGLNTAQKLALKDGVPSAILFRDFDGGAQDATAIRRTLDKAALRAGQEGGVVMMGRVRAETVSALVLWGLQDRSDTIALVPVSVVLAESLEP